MLLLIFGLLNPLTYYLGNETTASCDNVTFTPKDNGTYMAQIDYHYYNSSGKEFSGHASFESPKDDTIAMVLHPVKYLPFIPFCSVFVTGYTFPLQSIIFIASGVIFIILGLFIRTHKKEVATVPAEIPLYLCPACECEIDKDSIFCNYCGRKLIRKG